VHPYNLLLRLSSTIFAMLAQASFLFAAALALVRTTETAAIPYPD
jgi:hypothetical protein